MTSLPAHDSHHTAESTIKVWDPFVRFFHWSLATLFTIAFVTEDDNMLLHVWSGYFIGLLLALRFIWGLVGPRYARFNDFIYRPSSVIGYMHDLLRLKGKRYIGHSPAGGAMVLALILAIGAAVASGLLLYGLHDGAGPLKSLYGLGGRDFRHLVEEIHEFLANISLALVLAHIAGVLLVSFVHRENLAWCMITGRKRKGD